MRDPMTLSLPRGESYICQEGRPWLKPGTVVWVKPGHTARFSYLCIIRESEFKWCIPNTHTSQTYLELCTYKPFNHGAVIWEYWVKSLSPANKFFTLWVKFLLKIETFLK